MSKFHHSLAAVAKAVRARLRLAAPGPGALGEAEAVAIARQAREADDWATALQALERVSRENRVSESYLELRHWAMQGSGRSGSRNPWTKLKLEGKVFDLSPQESLVLTHLIHEVRPKMILELGSRGGGVAIWLSRLCKGLGIGARVHSADWGAGFSWRNSVQFRGGDLRNPSTVWPERMLKRIPHPALVLIRSQGGSDVTGPALRSLHQWMRAGDVICVESEADDRPERNPNWKSTSGHAMTRFRLRHPVEYEPLPLFEENFSPDSATPTLFRCLRSTGLHRLGGETAPELAEALALTRAKNWIGALEKLNARKAERIPLRGLDYLRSICFFEQKDLASACEAAKEELRYFPEHRQAKAMLASLQYVQLSGKPDLGGKEFRSLYRKVRPYTMMSVERLHSLYIRTKLVCQMDIPGDLVECGVAAGGGSAMIAATMALHTKRPRKLYSCDTFEGMPAPSEKDVSFGVHAEESGWGSGTCAAPPGSLLEICERLKVIDNVVPVKGFFKDTLPALKTKLNDGIALLHMDGDWYESTMDILVNLYDKVQPRGFIQIDDYGHWEGCRKAVGDFTAAREIEFDVTPIDGTGVWLQPPRCPASQLMMINLGCGHHYHRDWINVDIAPSTPDVIQHDLIAEPLPFGPNMCAVVYHSHVLEHLPRPAVPGFLSACLRVLAPGGVLRVAVPDLEGITREYLRQLDAGDQAKHEWMVYELVDQLSRHTRGGLMVEYWKQDPMPAEELVFARLGWEARRFVEKWRGQPQPEPMPTRVTPESVGQFRLSGEPHLWMYDRLSLGGLMENAGFTAIRVCSATESSIPGFQSYGLDADPSGAVRKPDSLFIEGVKPTAVP